MKNQFFFNMKKWFFICVDTYCSLRRTPYLLEEINTETEQVTILCRGSRAYIKTTIEGGIIAPYLIKGLPPMHACWIGYYYARLPLRKPLLMGFSMQTKKGRFRIISQEMRSSLLTYHDVRTNQIYKEKITDVMQNRFVIENIDSTCACYIGLQAGYAAKKFGAQVFDKRNTRSFLKRVK